MENEGKSVHDVNRAVSAEGWKEYLIQIHHHDYGKENGGLLWWDLDLLGSQPVTPPFWPGHPHTVDTYQYERWRSEVIRRISCHHQATKMIPSTVAILTSITPLEKRNSGDNLQQHHPTSAEGILPKLLGSLAKKPIKLQKEEPKTPRDVWIRIICNKISR